MMDGIIRDQSHFFYIGLAILGEVLLVHEDIHDLGNKVVSLRGLVDLCLDPAFQGHREIQENRGVDVLSLLHVPSGLRNLVGLVLLRDDAYKIRGDQSLLGGEGYREVWV